MNSFIVISIQWFFCLLFSAGFCPVYAEADPGAVTVFAQPRPGQPAALIDMTVHTVPVSPPSVSAGEIQLKDEELVIGAVIGGQAIAYPIRFMAMVEVVNDQVDDVSVAVTWCPLSGTGAIFSRRMDGDELTFDFGTGLKGDNLLIVDRETRSVWSQLQQQGISGPHKGGNLSLLPSLQTTWKAWRARYADTSVMVFPGHGGSPYFYRDFRSGRPRRASHDVSDLGLGLDLKEGGRWFFSFKALARHDVPLLQQTKRGLVSIYYDHGGLTAWAADEEGIILGGMLAYEKAWLEFFPDSSVFE